MGTWIGGMIFTWLLACGAAPEADPVPAARNAASTDQAGEEGGRGQGKPGRGKERGAEGGGGGGGNGTATPLAPPADPCGAWDDAGFHTFTMQFDGKEETALVSVPPGTGKRPMVVLLHGGDGDGEGMVRQTGILPVSKEQGFVVIAPSGAWIQDLGANKWNSGKKHHPDMRDDVRYLDALVEAVGKATCGGKVLAMGFSNGGQMANRWACEGQKVDGLLTASGTLLVDPQACTNRKSAVLAYVGTKDQNYDGAPTEGGLSAPDTVGKFWAPHNGCSTEFEAVKKGDTTCRQYKGCATPTQLCVIEDFGHGIPRGQNGKKPSDADATVDGLAWFKTVD